jgi:hypothetical protein
LRFIKDQAIVDTFQWSPLFYKERAMARLKQVILSGAAAAAIAFLPLAPAIAGGHGYRYGYVQPWGVGRGIIGAAVALATLPLAIASAVVSGVAAPIPAPAYGAGYYAPGPGYYPMRGYNAPRPYYARRPGYAGRDYYHSGGHAYPHR